MKGGYTGKMLFVDLTEGKIKEKELCEDMARQFIGGYGIGVRVLYSMMKPGVDPLGPDNVLGFVTGPLNGTGAFLGSRFAVVCKSPVTGGWNDANSGGFFGPELKKAGYDAVFISGSSDKPVYIWIKDGKTEIRDAAKLWGKDTVETLDILTGDIGNKGLRAAVIGPAGENLSLMACVINEKHRAAGRGGPGAVMGAKKLKAIAVRGTGEVPVADPEKLKEINRAAKDSMKNGPTAQMAEAFGKLGTGMGSGASALSGDSPVKNWSGVGISDFGEEKADKISAMSMHKYMTKKYACANCIIGCGAGYEVKDGEWPLKETFRPEYETSAAFGTMCLNDNAESIIKCNDICNRYGFDTISAGATIAWAIECYENGVLSKQETEGIELTWGNAKAIVEITQAIADNRGFGKILALGSSGAARKLGKGFEYLQTVKGIELPMHDPRLTPGYARTYQVDPTPARHVKGGMWQGANRRNPVSYDNSDTGPKDVAMTSRMELLQVSGICMFSTLVMRDMEIKLLEAVTGWIFDDTAQEKILKRVMGLRHAFNLREGFKPSDFVLPKRSVGEPPLEHGSLAGVTIDHKSLARNFFAAMEWDEETGKPSRKSLEELGGMDDVVKDLYG
ncbi:MAG: aldehyde ferredoxin oxidoreductase family protein [Syntrophales bacterium]